MSTSTILIVLLAIVIVLFYIIKKRSSKMAPDEFEQKLHQEPGLIIDVRTPRAAVYAGRSRLWNYFSAYRECGIGHVGLRCTATQTAALSITFVQDEELYL